MRKIYHIHIRKTAGTAIYSLLRSQYQDDEVCPIRSEIELRGKFPPQQRLSTITQYRLISGHFYSFGQKLTSEYSIVTFLRNPLDRTISAFNHIQNDQRDPFHKKLKGMSLMNALQSNLADLELQNGQTRFLVGNAGYDHRQLDQSAADIATAFIDKIAFVGIQEQMESSLQHLAIQLGIDVPQQIPRTNTQITKSGIKVSDLSADEIGFIREHNAYDLQIYEYAQRKHEFMCDTLKDST